MNDAKDAPVKRKKKKEKMNKPAAAAAAPETPKQVMFDKVLVREFSRCLSMDSVPTEGGWPLGLSQDITAEHESADSVDSFESDKQEKLKARWKEIHPDSLEPPTPLETRQWDYKPDEERNPLFWKLSEQERMQILIADSEGKSVKMVKPVRPVRKTHSTRSRSASVSEKRNETYPQDHVDHVSNELEQIRNQRSMEGSTGCSCRKLNVYIPPPNAGKKAARQRMNLSKVKEELQSRNLLPTEHRTREELERLLHDAVEQEPCCTDDCVCVGNGIGCQADTCSCWSATHQSDKGKKHSEDPTVIQKRCGNIHGMYVYDINEIDSFRKELLCQPVQNHRLDN